MRKKRVNKYYNLKVDAKQNNFSIAISVTNKNKINIETQIIDILIKQSNKSILDNNESLRNNDLNSSDISLDNEIKDSNENIINNIIINLDINENFKDIAKSLNPINQNDIKIIKVIGNLNYFYRCLSFFLFGNEKFYFDIKNEIKFSIDKNLELFKGFLFDDDEINKKTKEELSEEVYKYIKSKDSWGGFHTIEIAYIIFEFSICVYTDNGNNEFIRYSYSENIKDDTKLMLLSYHNKNHFDLINDK